MTQPVETLCHGGARLLLAHMLPRLLTTTALAAAIAGAAAAGPAPAYKGAISTDAATGAVLFESNADAISPPASMTKLMTFAVLDDELRKGSLSLETRVTITQEDARVGLLRKSTAVWLRQGEEFRAEELIYAMMIQSANDAAYALAHKAAGTVPQFVAMMNAKARELGMVHSTFRTPNGYPTPSHRIADGDLSTPRDYALLCRYLLQHTDVLKYTSVKTRPFGAGIRLQPVQMTNHNHLLGKIPGVDGLKTGFTDGAGFCLAATAQRNGRRIIVVMMDSPDSRTRDLNVEDLISQAFIRLPVVEAPFAPKAAAPTQPTRPSAAPPAPDPGPVIVVPRAAGK